MREDFNILENALLFAPEGTAIWSDVEGVVTLDRYHDRSWLNEEFPAGRICIEGDYTADYSLNGHYGEIGISKKGSCVLWPSKDHKTWNGWQGVLFKAGDFIYDYDKKQVVYLCRKIEEIRYKGKLANGKYTEGWLNGCRYPSMEQIEEYKKEQKKKSKLEASKSLVWVALRTMTDDNETAEEVGRWNSDYEIGLSDEEVRELIHYIYDAVDNEKGHPL